MEIKAKLPLIEDGQITINDAFSAIISAAPTKYKPPLLLVAVAFRSVVGDIGKELPEVVKDKVKTLKHIILLLEAKL